MLTPRFPNPAEDYREFLDWQRLLVRHPASTYPFVVESDDMSPLVRRGSILMVDRALPPVIGRLTVVEHGGGFLVRRLEVQDGQLVLTAENPHALTLAAAQAEITYWGPVVWILYNSLTNIP